MLRLRSSFPFVLREGFRLRVFFAAFCLIVLAVAFVGPVRAENGLFPPVQARTLNKERFVVPGSFKAGRNILMLSFGRDMQEPVEAWDAALAPLRESQGSVQVYNMPVIPNPGAIIRGFINSGFRGLYTDEALRDRVVILFVDDEFYEAAGISVEDRTAPLIIVTDQDGGIHGRVSGQVNEAAVTAVRALVME